MKSTPSSSSRRVMQQFVLEREVDALALAAIAQGGVVNVDACHGAYLRMTNDQ